MTSIEEEFDMSGFFKNNKKHISIRISNSKKSISSKKAKEKNTKKEPLDLKALKKEADEYNKNRVASLGKKKKQNLDR